MDVKEFKAWFEGFCDSIDSAPTAEQFAKIKAKVQGLDAGSKVTYRDYRDAGLPRGWPREVEPRISLAATAIGADAMGLDARGR